MAEVNFDAAYFYNAVKTYVGEDEADFCKEMICTYSGGDAEESDFGEEEEND